MGKKYFFLLTFLATFLTSCVSAGQNTKPIPTKAFVKVFRTLEVTKCKKDIKCSTGKWISTGSGVSVKLDNGKKIILTAGHICTPSFSEEFYKEVEEYSSFLHVLDYNSNMHQAHVIISELENGQGSIDACALFVPSFEGESVTISKVSPKPGDEIWTMAAPAGVYHPPTALIQKGVYSGVINASSSLISLHATGGSSGSGILNKNLELVGILFAVNSRFKSATIITNYKATLHFVKKVKSKINND